MLEKTRLVRLSVKREVRGEIKNGRVCCERTEIISSYYKCFAIELFITIILLFKLLYYLCLLNIQSTNYKKTRVLFEFENQSKTFGPHEPDKKCFSENKAN